MAVSAVIKISFVNIKGKEKGEVRLITGHESPEEGWRYSWTPSLTLALEGLGG